MSNNSQWLPAVVPLNRDSVIRKRHAPVRARPRLQTETTRTSNHALAWNLPPVPPVAPTGITAGTRLAIGTVAGRP